MRARGVLAASVFAFGAVLVTVGPADAGGYGDDSSLVDGWGPVADPLDVEPPADVDFCRRDLLEVQVNCVPVHLEVTSNLPADSAWQIRYLPASNCTIYETGGLDYHTGDPPSVRLVEAVYFAKRIGSCNFERSNAWFQLETGHCTGGFRTPDRCTWDGKWRTINVTEMNIIESLYTVECAQAGELPCSGTYGGKTQRGIPIAKVTIG
jgi:hypothetical protein